MSAPPSNEPSSSSVSAFGMKMTWEVPSSPLGPQDSISSIPSQAPSLDFKTLLKMKQKNQQQQQPAERDPTMFSDISSCLSSMTSAAPTAPPTPAHGSSATPSSSPTANSEPRQQLRSGSNLTIVTGTPPIPLQNSNGDVTTSPAATLGRSPSNVSPGSALRVSVYGPPQARRAPSSQRGPHTPTSTATPDPTTTSPSFNSSFMVPPLLGPAAITSPTLNLGPPATYNVSSSGTSPCLNSRNKARRSGVHSLIVVFVGTLEFERTLLAQKLARYLSWIGFAAKMFTAVDSTDKAQDPDDVEAVKFCRESDEYLQAAPVTPPTLWGQTLEECVYAISNFLSMDTTSSETSGVSAFQGQEPGSTTQPLDPQLSSGAIDARVALLNGEFPVESSRALVQELLLYHNPHADIMFVDLSPFSSATDDLQKSESGNQQQNDDGSTTWTASAMRRRAHQQAAAEDEVMYHPVEALVGGDDKASPQTKRMVFSFHEQGTTTLKNITGWLPSKVAFALMNFTPCLRRIERAEMDDLLASNNEKTDANGKKKKRKKITHPMIPIFFTRHGQSEYNLEDRLGGNPHLTAKGREDAECIGQFMKHEVLDNKSLLRCFEDTSFWDKLEGLQSGGSMDTTIASPTALLSPGEPFSQTSSAIHQSIANYLQLSECTRRMLKHTEVWTSQLTRTHETAQPTLDLGVTQRIWSQLNEIHAGVCEDLTNKEVKGIFPEIQQFRSKNKFAYRYPKGESYQDLMHRLEPVIVELETSAKCILVVGHQAILRTLLSYFAGVDAEQAVQTAAPQRTVWCCCFTPSGTPKLIQIALDNTAAAAAKEAEQGAGGPPLTELPSTPKQAVQEWSGW